MDIKYQGSRKAAQECSPRRQPWVCYKEGRSPNGAEDSALYICQHPATYGFQPKAVFLTKAVSERFVVAFLKKNNVAYDDKYLWG
jgi:hypothetical protein